MPVGVPFNVACYSILTRMIAQVVGMIPYEFIWSGGDVHVYNDQIEPLQPIFMRAPHPFPELRLDQDVETIDDFTIDSFMLLNYQHHPAIKLPVAV